MAVRLCISIPIQGTMYIVDCASGFSHGRRKIINHVNVPDPCCVDESDTDLSLLLMRRAVTLPTPPRTMPSRSHLVGHDTGTAASIRHGDVI